MPTSVNTTPQLPNGYGWQNRSLTPASVERARAAYIDTVHAASSLSGLEIHDMSPDLRGRGNYWGAFCGGFGSGYTTAIDHQRNHVVLWQGLPVHIATDPTFLQDQVSVTEHSGMTGEWFISMTDGYRNGAWLLSFACVIETEAAAADMLADYHSWNRRWEIPQPMFSVRAAFRRMVHPSPRRLPEIRPWADLPDYPDQWRAIRNGLSRTEPDPDLPDDDLARQILTAPLPTGCASGGPRA